MRKSLRFGHYGPIFSIKLTDALELHLSPESGLKIVITVMWTFCKTEQIVKMATTFTKKMLHGETKAVILSENSCHVVNLLTFAKRSQKSDYWFSLT